MFSWSTFALLVMAASHGSKKDSPVRCSSKSPIPMRQEGQFQEVKPLRQVEKETIIAALKQTQGDKLLAARELGIGKTTMYRKLKKYGIKS